MNPVGTKKQREDWRQLIHHRIDAPLSAALDGLDIAEKAMLALKVRKYFWDHEDEWKPCYLPYDVALCWAEDEARTAWDVWKGERK